MTRPTDRDAIEEIATRSEQRIVAQLEKRLNEALADQDARHQAQIGELQNAVRIGTATVTALIQHLAQTEHTPAAPPAELSRACGPSPERHLRRVELDVEGHAITQYVEPGADSGRIWDDVRRAVADTPETDAWRT